MMNDAPPMVDFAVNVVTKRLSDLQHSSYNPRTITRKAFAGLEKSIDKLGYLDPIIWNKRTGHVVGGHRRLDVLIKKAHGNNATVSVVEVDLSEEDEKRANVALNNPHIQGTFDREKLDAILPEIKLELGDIEFSAMCFDDLQIKIDLPDMTNIPEPGEGGEQKEIECPACGHRWCK